MFKKRPVRNLRQQRRSSDDDVEGEPNSVRDDLVVVTKTNNNGETTATADASPPITAVSSGSSLLSFDQEEEEDVEQSFKLKKSSHSRRLNKLRKEVKRVGDVANTADPTDEAIKRSSSLQSQSDAAAVNSAKNGTLSASTDAGAAVGFSTNNTVKDVKVEDPDEAEQGPDENSVRFAPRKKGDLKSVLQDGSIPDAQLVYEARKRRKMARMGGGDVATEESGKIPLTSTRRLDDTQAYRKEKGRLIREDIENDASDDEDMTLNANSFYSADYRKKNERERQQAEQDFLAAEQGDSDAESDDDDELIRWEKELIRKGVASKQQMAMYEIETDRQAANFHLATTISSDRIEEEPMELDMQYAAPSSNTAITIDSKTPKTGGAFPVKDMAIDVQTDDVIEKLKARAEDYGQMRRQLNLELDKLNEHLNDNEATLAKLEAELPTLNSKHELYQETRSYTTDLLDFLNEKIERLEELEERWMSLVASRSSYLVRRRRQDIKDQFEDCASAAATSGKTAAPKVPDAERMMRSAEREARRTRRRQAREKSNSQFSHMDGCSSDDEEVPSRIATFQLEKEKILNEARELFQDALEDFSTAEGVCGRFTAWLAADPSSFTDAYIDLCLHKVLVPIIRLELMAWNPLDSSQRPMSLDNMEWYRALLRAGAEHETLRDLDSTPMVKTEPRATPPPPIPVEPSQSCAVVVKLIPALVEKVIVPRLAELVERVWDPVSGTECRLLSATLHQLIDDYPTVCAGSKPLQRLLSALKTKARAALDDDLFMPIYSKQILENTACGAKTFLDRQFWFAIKVIKNLLLFNGVLSRGVLCELSVDGIINRQIVLGLQCGSFTDAATLDKCKALTEAFPKGWEWQAEDAKALEPLANVLMRMGKQVFKEASTYGYREITKEIAKMLKKFNFPEKAATLCDQAGINT